MARARDRLQPRADPQGARRLGGRPRGRAARPADSRAPCGSAGAAGSPRSRRRSRAHRRGARRHLRHRSISRREDYRGFYVGFANGALWPLLHFRIGLMQLPPRGLRGLPRGQPQLRRLARRRAAARRHGLGARLSPDPVRPHAARARASTGRIGFFLHIPFAPPSMMEALPVARELIADLCAYDLVGFQTEEHARDFRDCAQRMLGATVQGEWVRLNGRSMRAFAYPIGIDAEAFASDADRAANDKVVQRRARQPGRPRAGHRRRPHGLFQGPAAALRGLRATAREPSRAPSQGPSSCRSARARARRSTNTASCAPSSTGWPAASTAASRSSTGRRCATRRARRRARRWPASIAPRASAW